MARYLSRYLERLTRGFRAPDFESRSGLLYFLPSCYCWCRDQDLRYIVGVVYTLGSRNIFGVMSRLSPGTIDSEENIDLFQS